MGYLQIGRHDSLSTHTSQADGDDSIVDDKSDDSDDASWTLSTEILNTDNFEDCRVDAVFEPFRLLANLETDLSANCIVNVLPATHRQTVLLAGSLSQDPVLPKLARRTMTIQLSEEVVRSAYEAADAVHEPDPCSLVRHLAIHIPYMGLARVL